MATGQLASPLRHIRRLALQGAGGVGDAQLLAAVLTQKDEAAFEALVKRHGPMVLGVCRRVLKDPHDAEDAFQATFLVLIRKAAAIAKRELLGNWLYGVAYRAALKMKHAKATRRFKERQVDRLPKNKPPSPEISGELLYWLDHELNRLPEKYRAALVLCDLEGLTRDQASRRLSWPIGTLNWRLAKARSLVAQGLTRRGLTISCAALAALCQQSAAQVPPSLTATTAKLGTLLAGGAAAKLGVVTAQVASLTEGVVKAMFLSKLKGIALVLTISVAFVCGVGLVAEHGALAQEEVKKSTRNENTAKTPPAKPNAGNGPADYDAIFDKARAILGDYFAIDYANRHDGRMETLPALVSPAERSEGDQGAKTPRIRRRATLSIVPAGGGTYHVDVRVLKEASWHPGGSAKVYWNVVDRDKQLEQIILRRLGTLPSLNRDKLDIFYLMQVTLVEADPNGRDHGELGRGTIVANSNHVAREGDVCRLQTGGEFPVPIISTNERADRLQGASFPPIGLVCAFKVSTWTSDEISLESNVQLTLVERKDDRVSQIGSRTLKSIAKMKIGEPLKLTMKDEAGRPKYHISIRVLENDRAKSAEADTRRSRLANPPRKTLQINHRDFQIPINTDKSRRGEVKELVLFASWDEGRTYEHVAKVPADATEFRYEAPRDGTCWLRAAVIDRQGKQEPADIHRGQPDLKIVIDTTPP
jgi:RNA polymerase sigma factor (sigma-70 family)